jgi:hypothetical protein
MSASEKKDWGCDAEAWAFLESRGWTHNRGVMDHPQSDDMKIAADEYEAAQYLIDEWDYAMKSWKL